MSASAAVCAAQVVGRCRQPEPDSEDSPQKASSARRRRSERTSLIPKEVPALEPTFGSPRAAEAAGSRPASDSFKQLALPEGDCSSWKIGCAYSATDDAFYNPEKPRDKKVASGHNVSFLNAGPAFGGTFGDNCKKEFDSVLAASLPQLFVRLPRCIDLGVSDEPGTAQDRLPSVEPGLTRVKIMDDPEAMRAICRRHQLPWKKESHFHMNSKEYVVKQRVDRNTVAVYDEKCDRDGVHHGRVKVPLECVAILKADLGSFRALQLRISEQAVLGAARPCVAGLVRWYAPYVLFAVSYIAALAIAGCEEVLLLSVALPLSLFALNVLRLVCWNRALLAAVDAGAAEHARSALLPPDQGWGGGNAKYAAQLCHAMQAAAVPDGSLLLSGSQEAWPRSGAVAAAALSSALLAIRCSGLVAEVETPVACAVVLIALAAVCSPRHHARPRARVADRRLEALEAAFASLVDVLRPLSSGGRPAEVAGRRDAFSVRLVTTAWPDDAAASGGGEAQEPERQTLRAVLRLPRAGRRELHVACPPGDFTIRAGRVEHAVPDYLGKNAAGSIRIPQVRKAGLPFLPRSWSRALNRGAAGVIAAVGAKPEPRREAERSLHSASTASSVKSSVVDQTEATLHLAAAMSVVMGLRGGQPLEAFRDCDGAGPSLTAPKAAADEPCIVLGLGGEEVQMLAGCLSPEDLCVPSAACSGKRQRAAEDHFGVMRDVHQWLALRRGHTTPDSARTRSVADRDPVADIDDARSVSSSYSGFSLGGVSDCPSLAAATGVAGAAGGAPGGGQQLVLLFDSVGERDCCLDELRQVGALPTAHCPAG